MMAWARIVGVDTKKKKLHKYKRYLGSKIMKEGFYNYMDHAVIH